MGLVLANVCNLTASQTVSRSTLGHHRELRRACQDIFTFEGYSSDVQLLDTA